MCREAKLLLLISALFTLAMGLSNIFVNIFFWKQTSDFIIILIYNLLQYIAIPSTFFMAGLLSKKKNGIWSLRIGLMMFAIFYGLILAFGGRGVIYIYILGIVHGIAAGFYWLAFHTLSFDFTEVTNRDSFNGYKGFIAGITGAIAPITSGYIINAFGGIIGYKIIFTLTFVLFIVLVLISITLRCKNCGSDFDFHRALSRNCEDWTVIRKATMLWGVRDVIIAVLVNILIIEVTKSELSLGKLSLIGSLFSSAGYMIVQKVIKPKRRIVSIYIGTIFSFIGVLGLVINVSFKTLLIFTLVDSFFLPFFLIQLSSSTFNVINRIHEEDMRVEYVVNKELVLNIGRAASAIILILLLTIFKAEYMLRIHLLIIGIMPIVSGFFLTKLRKMLVGEKN